MNNFERDRAIERLQREVHHLWCRVLRIEESEFVVATSFYATLENPMTVSAPGNTIVVTFAPVPANATITQPPTITSSDPVNAPVVVDETGLIGTVTFPQGAVVGTPFTLDISYANPDGNDATGNFSDTIVAPVIDVTSFTSAQTS